MKTKEILKNKVSIVKELSFVLPGVPILRAKSSKEFTSLSFGA